MMRKKMIILLGVVALVLLAACGEKKPEYAKYHRDEPIQEDYQNGVAWVRLYEPGFFGSTSHGLLCVNEDGEELFYLPEARQSNVSKFYDNVAIIESEFLINKKGDILHDIKNELNIKDVIIPDDNYFDGFIIVGTIVNEVYMTGLANKDMEWILQPTSKLNDMEPKGNFLYYAPHVGYFDALNKEFIDESAFRARHLDRSFMDNGLIFLYHGNGSQFKYSSELTTGEIYLKSDWGTGFYNKNLDVVIDFSDYEDVVPLSNFNNGTCLIKFSTQNSETYTGLIDEKGQFLFVRDEYVKEFDNQKIAFSDGYYDWNGKFYLYESENGTTS